MVQNQQNMVKELTAAMDEIYEKQSNIINGMMEPQLEDCSYEEKTLTISFPVLDWELNRAGSMHGGVIGAAFDIAMGVLTRCLTQENFVPTINLETVFIRPIPPGDHLVIKAKANIVGKTLVHLYAEGHLKSSVKLAATSSASYLNMNTSMRPDA